MRLRGNQLRVLLSPAAYVLTQALQIAVAGTTLAHAQAARLHQALLTIGVQVTRSVRRLVVHLARSHPEHAAWHHVACAGELQGRAGCGPAGPPTVAFNRGAVHSRSRTAQPEPSLGKDSAPTIAPTSGDAWRDLLNV
jgi:hypothetical protein